MSAGVQQASAWNNFRLSSRFRSASDLYARAFGSHFLPIPCGVPFPCPPRASELLSTCSLLQVGWVVSSYLFVTVAFGSCVNLSTYYSSQSVYLFTVFLLWRYLHSSLYAVSSKRCGIILIRLPVFKVGHFSPTKSRWKTVNTSR